MIAQWCHGEEGAMEVRKYVRCSCCSWDTFDRDFRCVGGMHVLFVSYLDRYQGVCFLYVA